MKNTILLVLLLVAFSTAKAQSSFTIVNNTISSVCSLKVFISYYNRSCGLITKSSAVVIPNGVPTTINISSLSWGPVPPDPLDIPTFTVYYPNVNGIPCSTQPSVGGPCYPSTAALGMCHPSCTNATVSYDAATATLTVN